MFIVLLKFSENKANAKKYMEAHNTWIKQGFDDGVFLLVGSLVDSIEPSLGGSVLAYNTSREELEQRVQADPFVAENVVSAEIIEISPKKVDERFNFLKEAY